MRNLYTGFGIYSLDPKNRVYLASEIRNKITEPIVVCYSLFQAPHLTVYQQSDYQTRVDSFADPLSNNEAAIDLLTHGFLTNETRKIDGAGRLVLTETAVEHAGLINGKKQLVIKGDLDHFSIWDLKTYKEATAKQQKLVDLRQAVLRAETDGVSTEQITAELSRLLVRRQNHE